MDRGKKGSKIHVITDAQGPPLVVGVSAANLHDSQALEPMVRGIPPLKSRRGPRRRRPAKLRADKGFVSFAGCGEVVAGWQIVNDVSTVRPLTDATTCTAGPADWPHLAPYLVDYTTGTTLHAENGTLTTETAVGTATWELAAVDGVVQTG